MNYVSKFNILDSVINIKDAQAIKFFNTMNDAVSSGLYSGELLYINEYKTGDGCPALYSVTKTPETSVYDTVNELYVNLINTGYISPLMHGETASVNLNTWLNMLKNGTTLDISGYACSITPTNTPITDIHDITIIADNATITSNPFNGADLRQLYFEESDNINIYGGVWNHPASVNSYTNNREQCHVMRFTNCNNLHVKGCELMGASGDGIEYGARQLAGMKKLNAIFEALNIHDVHRNGISILTCENVRISNCIFNNITNDKYNSVMPLGIIDCEAFFTGATMNNVTIDNCISGYTAGGIICYAATGDSVFNITNCKATNLLIDYRSDLSAGNTSCNTNINNLQLTHTCNIYYGNVTGNVAFNDYAKQFNNLVIGKDTTPSRQLNINIDAKFIQDNGNTGGYCIMVNNYMTSDSLININTNTNNIRNQFENADITTTSINLNSNASLGNGQNGYVHSVVARNSTTQSYFATPQQVIKQPLLVIFNNTAQVVDNTNGKLKSNATFPVTVNAGDMMFVTMDQNGNYIVNVLQ